MSPHEIVICSLLDSSAFVVQLYEPVIKTIKSLVHFESIGHNLLIIGVFGLGIVFGIVGIARLILRNLAKSS